MPRNNDPVSKYDSTPKRKASKLDKHIGTRIKLAREQNSIKLNILAPQIGLTYQQLSKYESGKTRVTAIRLRRLAAILNRPMDWFFDGFDDEPLSGLPYDLTQQLKEEQRLIAFYKAIASPEKKAVIMELARVLSGIEPKEQDLNITDDPQNGLHGKNISKKKSA